MHVRALRSISLQAALLISTTLGGVSGVTADPGPKCTLKTPAAEAECGTIRMVIGARTTSLDPTFGGPSTDYQPMYSQEGLLYRYDQNLVPRMDLIDGRDGFRGRPHHHAEDQEGREIFRRHSGRG